jgi:hypothetical protein
LCHRQGQFLHSVITALQPKLRFWQVRRLCSFLGKWWSIMHASFANALPCGTWKQPTWLAYYFTIDQITMSTRSAH